MNGGGVELMGRREGFVEVIGLIEKEMCMV